MVGDIDVEKHKFRQQKISVIIDYVDIHKIIVTKQNAFYWLQRKEKSKTIMDNSSKNECIKKRL